MLILLAILGIVAAEPSLRQATFQGKSLRILPLGGSITWGQGSSDGNGYREDLRNLLSPADVTYIGTQCSGDMQNGNNEGHRDYRIAQMEAVAAPDIALQPNVVLVYAGTNDMLTQQAYEAPGNMQQLVRYLVANLPDALIVVSKLFLDTHPQVAQRIDVFDSELEVTQLGNVMIADMSDLLTASDLGPDGEHPNDTGFTKMAQTFFDVLVQAESEGRIANPSHIQYTPDCNGPPVFPTTSLTSSSQPAAASTTSKMTSTGSNSGTDSEVISSTRLGQSSSSSSVTTSQTLSMTSSVSSILSAAPTASQTTQSMSVGQETSTSSETPSSSISVTSTTTATSTSQTPTNLARKLITNPNANIPLLAYLVWLIL